MASRTWLKRRVAMPPRSSSLLPRASKFIKRPLKKNGPSLPGRSSRSAKISRRRGNSAQRRSRFTRNFCRPGKPLKILSLEWKLSGRSQSKLERPEALQSVQGSRFNVPAGKKASARYPIQGASRAPGSGLAIQQLRDGHRPLSTPSLCDLAGNRRKRSAGKEADLAALTYYRLTNSCCTSLSHAAYFFPLLRRRIS